MSIKHTITEKKDTITMHFDVSALEKLPLKVALSTLRILEENNQLSNTFLEFDKPTQEFIDKNKNEYKKLTHAETPEFAQFRQFFFDSLKGPLYLYGERVLEVVSRIYDTEKYFDDITSINVPKIVYKIGNTRDECNQLPIDVKNLNELVEKFGQAVTRHGIIYFKEHLNYDYQVTNKTSAQPYGISPNILQACWDEKNQIHPELDYLEGKDYMLDSQFQSQIRKVSSPEEIFQLLLIFEEVKKHLRSENNNDDTSKKQKKSFK